MCGFGGLVHWDLEKVAPDDLEQMVALLGHRGPDEGRTAFPSPGVGLSHCRLRIIDLSNAASQPMANEEKSIWLLFNGEIYNFRELRAELEQAGWPFHSQSDTEVVLRAYEAWGTEAIRRLDGMFAFAIWDASRRELLLARDRTGKKPLYYWSSSRCTAFGSEIKALFSHQHVPRRFDEKRLVSLLTLGYPETGRTCYNEIRHVPPATILRFKPDQTEPLSRTYWNLPSPQAPSLLTPSRAISELRLLLTDAVRRRLVADVPLGAFLSGGIDSSIVVGLMSRLQPDRPVKTFSIGFQGDPRFNETAYAQIAADRFRTQHTPFILSPVSFDLMEKLVWHYDQPFGDSSAIPTYLLSQWTRSEVTVALSGDGGDELFAGYDRFRAALLAERIPLFLRRVGNRLFRSGRLLSNAHIRSPLGRMRKFLSVSERPFIERFLTWAGFFADPEEFLLRAQQTARKIPFPISEESLKSLPDGSMLSRLLALNFREYLPNDLHVKTDRCSMAHGLEVRSPFLDTALIEWAFRLPDDLKLRNGKTKWILREAFADLLPPAIQHRKKMGFGVPLGTWLRGQWRQPLQDLLLPASSRIHRYLKRERVTEMVNGHLSGAQENGHPLWLLLTFEVWLRQMERPVAASADISKASPIEVG